MKELSRYLLSHLDLIRLEGQDALKFLQGQCTQDVSNLDPQTPLLGAFCNAKGRAVCNVWLFKNPTKAHTIYMLCERTSAPVLYRHLAKYVAFFRGTKMTHQPDAYIGVGLSGPDAVPTAVALAPTVEEGFCTLWGTSRAMLWLPSGQALPGDLSDIDLSAVQHWQADDIRELKLWLDSDQVEQWIPQNVNLDTLNGISFSKGCYTGQEVVARLHYKGQSKKRLFVVQWDNTDPLDTIYSARGSIGSVIQQSVDQDSSVGLAVLKTDAVDAPLFGDENQQVTIKLLH